MPGSSGTPGLSKAATSYYFDDLASTPHEKKSRTSTMKGDIWKENENVLSLGFAPDISDDNDNLNISTLSDTTELTASNFVLAASSRRRLARKSKENNSNNEGSEEEEENKNNMSHTKFQKSSTKVSDYVGMTVESTSRQLPISSPFSTTYNKTNGSPFARANAWPLATAGPMKSSTPLGGSSTATPSPSLRVKLRGTSVETLRRFSESIQKSKPAEVKNICSILPFVDNTKDINESKNEIKAQKSQNGGHNNDRKTEKLIQHEIRPIISHMTAEKNATDTDETADILMLDFLDETVEESRPNHRGKFIQASDSSNDTYGSLFHAMLTASERPKDPGPRIALQNKEVKLPAHYFEHGNNNSPEKTPTKLPDHSGFSIPIAPGSNKSIDSGASASSFGSLFDGVENESTNKDEKDRLKEMNPLKDKNLSKEVSDSPLSKYDSPESKFSSKRGASAIGSQKPVQSDSPTLDKGSKSPLIRQTFSPNPPRRSPKPKSKIIDQEETGKKKSNDGSPDNSNLSLSSIFADSPARNTRSRSKVYSEEKLSSRDKLEEKSSPSDRGESSSFNNGDTLAAEMPRKSPSRRRIDLPTKSPTRDISPTKKSRYSAFEKQDAVDSPPVSPLRQPAISLTSNVKESPARNTRSSCGKQCMSPGAQSLSLLGTERRSPARKRLSSIYEMRMSPSQEVQTLARSSNKTDVSHRHSSHCVKNCSTNGCNTLPVPTSPTANGGKKEVYRFSSKNHKAVMDSPSKEHRTMSTLTESPELASLEDMNALFDEKTSTLNLNEDVTRLGESSINSSLVEKSALSGSREDDNCTTTLLSDENTSKEANSSPEGDAFGDAVGFQLKSRNGSLSTFARQRLTIDSSEFRSLFSLAKIVEKESIIIHDNLKTAVSEEIAANSPQSVQGKGDTIDLGLLDDLFGRSAQDTEVETKKAAQEISDNYNSTSAQVTKQKESKEFAVEKRTVSFALSPVYGEDERLKRQSTPISTKVDFSPSETHDQNYPKSILNSGKKKSKLLSRLSGSDSETKKRPRTVAFGSPVAAEYNKGSPSMSMTPLPPSQVKHLFSIPASYSESESDVSISFSDVRDESELSLLNESSENGLSEQQHFAEDTAQLESDVNSLLLNAQCSNFDVLYHDDDPTDIRVSIEPTQLSLVEREHPDSDLESDTNNTTNSKVNVKKSLPIDATAELEEGIEELLAGDEGFASFNESNINDDEPSTVSVDKSNAERFATTRRISGPSRACNDFSTSRRNDLTESIEDEDDDSKRGISMDSSFMDLTEISRIPLSGGEMAVCYQSIEDVNTEKIDQTVDIETNMATLLESVPHTMQDKTVELETNLISLLAVEHEMIDTSKESEVEHTMATGVGATCELEQNIGELLKESHLVNEFTNESTTQDGFINNFSISMSLASIPEQSSNESESEKADKSDLTTSSSAHQNMEPFDDQMPTNLSVTSKDNITTGTKNNKIQIDDKSFDAVHYTSPLTNASSLAPLHPEDETLDSPEERVAGKATYPDHENEKQEPLTLSREEILRAVTKPNESKAYETLLDSCKKLNECKFDFPIKQSIDFIGKVCSEVEKKIIEIDNGIEGLYNHYLDVSAPNLLMLQHNLRVSGSNFQVHTELGKLALSVQERVHQDWDEWEKCVTDALIDNINEIVEQTAKEENRCEQLVLGLEKVDRSVKTIFKRRHNREQKARLLRLKNDTDEAANICQETRQAIKQLEEVNSATEVRNNAFSNLIDLRGNVIDSKALLHTTHERVSKSEIKYKTVQELLRWTVLKSDATSLTVEFVERGSFPTIILEVPLDEDSKAIALSTKVLPRKVGVPAGTVFVKHYLNSFTREVNHAFCDNPLSVLQLSDWRIRRGELICQELNLLLCKFEGSIKEVDSETIALTIYFYNKKSSTKLSACFDIKESYPNSPMEVFIQPLEGDDINVKSLSRHLLKTARPGFGYISRSCDVINAFMN